MSFMPLCRWISVFLSFWGIAVVACSLPGQGINQESAIPTAANPAWVGGAGETKIVQKTLLADLEHPWGLTWVTDDTVLITLRPGRLVSFSLQDQSVRTVAGMPSVFASGQGGLLDVVAHPEFEQNRWVYFSYAQGDRQHNRTTVSRAKFQNNQLSEWETIFSVADSKSGSQHFGSRLLWLPDGTLLVSIGDGGNPPLQFRGGLIRNQAQNLGNSFWDRGSNSRGWLQFLKIILLSMTQRQNRRFGVMVIVIFRGWRLTLHDWTGVVHRAWI